MTNREILEALDAAGEALAGLGETGLTFGRYVHEGDRPRYTCRLDCAGTPGIHGSGLTWSAAFADALANRSDKMREMDVRAQVEAEVARRMQPQDMAA